MTDEEKIEYDKWEEEYQKQLKAWYEETLPTMPYYTPTKEQIYVGMLVEKRVFDWDMLNYEICCSGYACHIYSLTPHEELSEHCQHIWKYVPHVITQEEYDRHMIWNGDYRSSPGLPLEGEIRIKKEKL